MNIQIYICSVQSIGTRKKYCDRELSSTTHQRMEQNAENAYIKFPMISADESTLIPQCLMETHPLTTTVHIYLTRYSYLIITFLGSQL
jgi:ureidoglycolate hydrolase